MRIRQEHSSATRQYSWKWFTTRAVKLIRVQWMRPRDALKAYAIASCERIWNWEQKHCTRPIQVVRGSVVAQLFCDLMLFHISILISGRIHANDATSKLLIDSDLVSLKKGNTCGFDAVFPWSADRLVAHLWILSAHNMRRQALAQLLNQENIAVSLILTKQIV